jgi:hypothetical protein
LRPLDRLRVQLTRAAAADKAHIPEAGRMLWRWFLDLSLARTYGPHGPNPITYAEIDAWRRVCRVPVAPHHVAILRDMDAAWMQRARAEIRRAAGNEGPSTLPPVSKQEINPALFDAMFQ